MIIINLYSTLRELPEAPFPVLAQRSLDDPELANHLHGFSNYVRSRVEKMNGTVYAVLRHLQRVQHHCSLEVEQEQLEAFGDWAERANGICFWRDGSVRDPAGRVLLDAEGETDQEARIPYPPDALARRERNRERLASLEIKVPEHLPPVVGKAEARVRDPEEVARRALALTVVAVRAESVSRGEPLPLEIFPPVALTGLSPREKAFLQQESSDDAVPMVWRYEALLTLLWALGHFPELPDPTAICDVCAVAGLVRAQGEDLLKARLRPATELLDELDRAYRLHWAVRQARLKGREPPGGLIPGVVLERHYALNWLFRFEEADWDRVDTPT